MERIRRTKLPEAVVEDDDTVDTENEPEYEVEVGESAQEAQDRIEAKYRDRATSPLRAIRAFCVLCMGAQPREVKNCTAYDCVLYPMRLGTNPFQKRKPK